MGLKPVLQEATVWRATRVALGRFLVFCLVLQGMVAVRHIHPDAAEPEVAVSNLLWADHHDGPDGSAGHNHPKKQKSDKDCPACLAASMGAHALLGVATPALPLPQSQCQAEQYAASSLDAVVRLASPIRAPPFQMNA